MIHRTYYKCIDCLSTFAINPDPDIKYNQSNKKIFKSEQNIKCECGSIQFDKMGHVEKFNFVTGYHNECPCDGRCTNARGPNCDCQCGGENHGTGRTITITHYGTEPKIVLPDKKLVSQGIEFRNLRNRVIELVWKKYKNESNFEKMYQHNHEELLIRTSISESWDYRKAINFKNQKKRINLLTKILDKLENKNKN